MQEGRRTNQPKRVNLDCEPEQVQAFIRSLPVGREGCVLVVDGKPLLQVLPITDAAVDHGKLKAAILKRRAESRQLNQEWEAVDREAWNKFSDVPE